MVKLADGRKVSLVLRHGSVDRVLTGTLRRFETVARFDPTTGKKIQDAETRWELVDATDDRTGHPQRPDGKPAYEESARLQRYEAIGIVPENVVSIEDLT